MIRGHLRKRAAARDLRRTRRELSLLKGHGRGIGRIKPVFRAHLTKKYIYAQKVDSAYSVGGVILRRIRSSLLDYLRAQFKRNLSRLWQFKYRSIVATFAKVFRFQARKRFHQAKRHLYVGARGGVRRINESTFLKWRYNEPLAEYYKTSILVRRYILKRLQTFCESVRRIKRYKIHVVFKKKLILSRIKFLAQGLQKDVEFLQENYSASQHLPRLVFNTTARRAGRFESEIYSHLGKKFLRRVKGRKQRMRDHYTKRVLKYKTIHTYVVVARWGRITLKRLLAKTRLELSYLSEPVVLAPRLFMRTNPRTKAIEDLFYSNASESFNFFYTAKTYVDKLLTVGNLHVFKSFVFFYKDGDAATIEALQDVIVKFKETSVEFLKMKKVKNKPDICWSTNVALYWGVVQTTGFEYTHEPYELLSLFANFEEYSFALCVEVYKVWVLLSYKTIKC